MLKFQTLYCAVCGVLIAAAATMAVARIAAPVYGPAILILLAALVAIRPLTKWFEGGEVRRKRVKTTLDALWNFWAFLTTATLFASAMLSGDSTMKMDALLAGAPAGLLTTLFSIIAMTAAARLSVALTELCSIVKAPGAHDRADRSMVGTEL